VGGGASESFLNWFRLYSIHALRCSIFFFCIMCCFYFSLLDANKMSLFVCSCVACRMFGSTGTCAACRQPIPASQLVMRARQDAYHVDCFTCVVCGVRLVPGDRFAVVNGSILCETDYPKICGLQAERRQSGIRCISSGGVVDI